jgi:hypothetical protein
MMFVEIRLSDHQALQELHDLLSDSSLNRPPSRDLAARYQVCRTTLMAGTLRPHLPGFVRQCVSLLKFREFICLYDRDPSPRLRFIDRSLENCWIKLNQPQPRRARETFDAEDF